MSEEIDGRDIVIACLKRRIKRLKKANEELIQALWTEINKPTITYILWPVLPEYPPAWPEYPSPPWNRPNLDMSRQ